MTFFILAASSILGAFGAWLVIRFGTSLGLVDIPNSRSSHTVPTPKGGGIGIVMAFITCALFLKLSPLFWIPIVFLSIISLIGDSINISPNLRLILQFAIAFIVLLTNYNNFSFLIYLNQISNLEIINAMLFCSIAIFIVGTANFYNFMDGINGIAALTGIIAFCLLSIFGLVNNVENNWIILSFALALACLGFLPFNFPKAKVFMGDVGSIFLGFIYAIISLIMACTLGEFILLCSFLFPFYADELITMIERIRDGQSLTKPHRRHLYQVLANEAGFPHWKISGFYGLFQIVTSLIFWQAFRLGVWQFLTTISINIFLFILVNNKLKKTVHNFTDPDK